MVQKNKAKNQRRKKKNKKTKRRNRQLQEEQKAQSTHLQTLSQNASVLHFQSENSPFEYVPPGPCLDSEDPDHYLTCPYFDLDVDPLPDSLLTRETRITHTFKNVYLETSTLTQANFEKEGKANCVFTRIAPDGAKHWYRGLLPAKNEFLQEKMRRFENRIERLGLNPLEKKEKSMFITKAVGPLLMRGTIVGFDHHGVQLPSFRLPDADVAVVLQDIAVERMPQTESKGKDIPKAVQKEPSVHQYSSLFTTIYDEEVPLGESGRGTHCSVLQWKVGRFFMSRCIVIWDEDHDLRVIKVIEQMLREDLLESVLFIAERKGNMTILLREQPLNTQSYARKVQQAMVHVKDSIYEFWPVQAYFWGEREGVRVMLNDPSETAQNYLQDLSETWELELSREATEQYVKRDDWVDLKIWLEPYEFYEHSIPFKNLENGQEVYEFSIPFQNLFEELEQLRQFGSIIRPDGDLPEVSASVVRVEVCGEEVPFWQDLLDTV